jgi:hypothetical protein
MLAFVKHHNLNATKEFTLDSEKKSSVKEDWCDYSSNFIIKLKPHNETKFDSTSLQKV